MKLDFACFAVKRKDLTAKYAKGAKDNLCRVAVYYKALVKVLENPAHTLPQVSPFFCRSPHTGILYFPRQVIGNVRLLV